MTSRKLREKIGLTRLEWARALNITVRTVERWEDDEHEPTGIAAGVISAIESAIDHPGSDPARIGRALRLGIAGLLFHRLTNL